MLNLQHAEIIRSLLSSKNNMAAAAAMRRELTNHKVYIYIKLRSVYSPLTAIGIASPRLLLHGHYCNPTF